MSLLDVSMLAYIHQVSSLDFNRGGSPKGPRCVGLVSFDSVSLNPNFFRDTYFKGPCCVGSVSFDSFKCFFESKLFQRHIFQRSWVCWFGFF